MLPRFHWADITTVGHYLGVLILLTGAAMSVPELIAIVFAEYRQIGAFLVGIGVCLIVGSALCFLRSHRMDRRRSLLLVGFGWIAIGLVAAVPLLFSGSFNSLFDALFDSVSALTSTGVSLAGDVDALGYAQITWRVIMSFSGALMVVIIAMYSGFFGEGSKVFIMTARKDGARKQARIKETALLIVRVYGLFALIGLVVVSIICLTLGLNPVDAIFNGFWLAFTAVGTGGFVPHASDLVYYHSLHLDLTLNVLMLVGALSFGVFVYMRRGRYGQVINNAELRYYVLWIVVLVVFITVPMTAERIFTSTGAFMQNGLVTVVSAATTCGMQSVYPEQIGNSLSEGVVIVLIVAFLLGACAYSTGGGIKFVRILQVLRWIKYSILVRLVPDNARVRIKYEHFGSRSLSSRDAQIAMTVFILYLGTAALGSMAFIACGNDALDSVFEAISYVSNCGMTTSITEQGLPFVLKVVALLLMWAGRIEFVALIAAIVGILISIRPSNLFSNTRSRDLRSQKNEKSGGMAWRSRKGKRFGFGRRDKDESSGRVLGLVIGLMLAAGLAFGGAAAVPAIADPNGAEVSADEVQGLSRPNDYALVDVSALLSAGERQDNRDVQLYATATGSPLNAGNGQTWVNVKDGAAMIGICMDSELARSIEHYGSYGENGDILLVKGTYHLACPEHNGELDVHAAEIEVASEGGPKEDSLDPTLCLFGALLTLLGTAILFAYLTLRGKVRWRRLFKKVRH